MAALEGDGYSYAIPTGWEDATDWARDVAPTSAESAVAVEQPDEGFGTNVLVTAWDASGATGVEEAREDWFSVDYGRLRRLESTSIDGEQALGLRWEGRNDSGRRVVQIGYLAFWNDRAYSIVLSARPRTRRTTCRRSRACSTPGRGTTRPPWRSPARVPTCGRS